VAAPKGLGGIVTSSSMSGRRASRLVLFQQRFTNLGMLGERNTIREAERVSAFKNFFIRRSVELFSLLVLETVQSEGTCLSGALPWRSTFFSGVGTLISEPVTSRAGDFSSLGAHISSKHR
jgi:hypothetical protein